MTQPRRTQRTVRNLTVVSDFVLFNVAFVLAYLARYRWEWLLEVEPQNFVPFNSYRGQQLLLTGLLAIIFTQLGVWRRRRGELWLDEMARISYATAMGFALIMAYTFFFRPLAVSRLMLFWAALLTLVLLGVVRLIRRWSLLASYRRGHLVDDVLLVGSGEPMRSVMRTLLARPDLGFRAIGYLCEGPDEANLGVDRIPNLGHWRRLKRILLQNPQLHTVFIAFPLTEHALIVRLVRICQKRGVNVQVAPDLFQLSFRHVELNNMGGIPMMGVRPKPISQAVYALKRATDLLMLMIFAAPASLLGLLIALAIWLESRGPVFYRQERIGQGGRRFHMVKFRSMIVDADAMKRDLLPLNEVDGPIFKIKDDPRLTRVGRVIRRLSLDEIPQFYNVLLGHMSMVGPRPPLAEEVAQYETWHMRRLEVPGGLTGLWQISGRSDLTFDEQCLLDLYYIENWTLGMDIRIILQTVPYLLFSRGAY